MGAIERVAAKYNKYPVDTYIFIFEVLDWIDLSFAKKHLTGKELALAAYAFSVLKYGMLARNVWEEMCLLRSEDLGQVVFHLVEEGLMSREDSDKIEDFDNIFDLTAFDKTLLKIEDDLKPKPRVTTNNLGVHVEYQPPQGLKLNKN